MSTTILKDIPSQSHDASQPRVGPLTHSRALSALGVVVTRCEAGLAALFLWAAFNKLRPPNGPQLFSDSVRAFKLGLPEVFVRLATSATPWIEVIAGVCLILGIWSRAAAAILSALLVAFIALIAQALFRGLSVECGCFGKLSPFCTGPVGSCNIIQNAIMLGASLVILCTPRHRLVSNAPGG